jgi:hypothetical protein
MTKRDVLEYLKMYWQVLDEGLQNSYGRVAVWYIRLPCLVQLLIIVALGVFIWVTLKYQEPIDAFFEKALR